MNYVQSLLQTIEVGKGQVLVRIVPLAVALLVVGMAYDFSVYRGLGDAQSMDNAQVARQLARGEGFTTKFIRPHAVAQMQNYKAAQDALNGGGGDLFPASEFPPGKPRILPDTYNAPGYPFLLGVWFRMVHPEFDQPINAIIASHVYSGDRWIPPLNQFFMVLTGLLVFMLGKRLFDDRVAWMSMISFFCTDLVWHYSISAMSTTFLMFLIIGLLFCALEIFYVGERCFLSEEESFAPAFLWAILLGLLLAVACLSRLHLLVLLAPLLVTLLLMPRANLFVFVVIFLIVGGLVTPWFWHEYNVSGNPIGSNTPQLIYGEDDYAGNQIFCTTTIPSYERLFKDSSKKEALGFRWHFEHGWNLLGATPLALLFAVSILHRFKRRPAQLFHWLVISSAVCIVGANNLGVSNPEAFDAWNTLVVLLPPMMVIGAAFFFILIDRLNLQLWLISHLIVTVTIVLTVIPVLITISSTTSLFYNFPPYMPPAIKVFGQYAQPDEWITTDMPWATAWYADRPSLWLPDSMLDFEHIHDNVCPTGVLLLTPVTWSAPLSAVTTKEYKDWSAIALSLAPPANFPLTQHTTTAPGGPEYSIWSDRARWAPK